MAEHSNIEWCDHTFNPWVGCTPISPACVNCYAAAWAKRAGRDFSTPSRTKTWAEPKKWQANAQAFMAEHGRRQRVFCASLADVFDNQVPTEWRDDLWRLIEATPDLDWLLLTKRIGNVDNMLPLPFDFAEKYPHVWIGATITSQAEADRDVRKLLKVDARVRFLSMEPLLGPVDLTDVPGPESGHGHHEFSPIITINSLKRADWSKPHIDWVIVGGESGPGARPTHPDWARSLRDQCAAAGVPFLFKQWGNFLPASADNDDPSLADVPESRIFWSDGSKWDRFDGQRAGVDLVASVGKKAAGRLLDRVEHNGFPKVQR